MTEIQRSVLPIPEVVPVGLTSYDAKDPSSSFAPIAPVRPPAGAPDVLVILIDDLGFGASSAFGGPCAAPTALRLAAGVSGSRGSTRRRCLLRRGPRS